ncbi:MAG TPA: hypothetical protein VNI84_15375 [Pyrinomonadaceae bacterium]|nr:hypothetical protein [Pyrinomonadaceae bacterium]
MLDKLEVSFNSPQCGFMSIGFSDGASEFHTTTAHAPHERALPELLRILSALLDDNSEQNEYVLEWNREPEEFDFRFFKGEENLILEIYQYPGEKRLPAERELVFAHAGNLRDTAEAFHATFAQLYKDKDTDEFASNWRKPFPFAEFENFERSLENYGR